MPVTVQLPSTGTSGAPTAGRWQSNTLAVDTTGRVWQCTADGSPGAWQLLGNGTSAAASGLVFADAYPTLADAVAAVPAFGTLWLDAETTYQVNTPIGLAAQGVTIEGNGAQIQVGAAPTGLSSTDDTIFVSNGQPDCEIRNLRFIPPVGAHGASAISAPIRITDPGWRVTKCRNTTGSCLFVYNEGSDVEIDHNYTNGSGIGYAYNGASRVKCHHNRIISATTGSGGLSNALNGVGNGAAGVWNDDNQVYSNVVISPARMGIEDQQQTRNTRIFNNTILLAADQGISTNGLNPSVHGNNVIDCGPSGDGIELASGSGLCNFNTVEYRTVTSTAYGIVCDGGTGGGSPYSGHCTISANRVVNASTGIGGINNAQAVNIIGNTIIEPTYNGIQVTHTGTGASAEVLGNSISYFAAPTNQTNRNGILSYLAPIATIKGNRVYFGANTYGAGCADGTISLQGPCLIEGNVLDVGDRANPAQMFGISTQGNNNVPGVAIIGNHFRNGTCTAVTINGMTGLFARDNVGWEPFTGNLAPAVPASGTAVTNTGPGAMLVYFGAGWTITAITVGNQNLGVTAGPVLVPAGVAIAVTYTAAGTWFWQGT